MIDLALDVVLFVPYRVLRVMFYSPISSPPLPRQTAGLPAGNPTSARPIN